MACLTDAAAAVESDAFDAASLAEVSERPDALGQLARVFQRMAREVCARQQRLQQQVQELRIELDEARQQSQIAEITGTDYFRDLCSKARELRDEMENGTDGESHISHLTSL